MSGALPISPIPASVQITQREQVLFSEATSGREQVRRLGGHKWMLNLSYANLSRQQFMPIMAFLTSQGGRFETFTVIPPDLATPRGSALGTPVVSGAGQSGNTLVTSGWSIAQNGLLLAGDVIKLSYSKVYMVTQDVNSDGVGNATITFHPELFVSPANAESVIITNVPFKVRLANNIQQYSVKPPTLYDFSMDVMESY